MSEYDEIDALTGGKAIDTDLLFVEKTFNMK